MRYKRGLLLGCLAFDRLELILSRLGKDQVGRNDGGSF